MMGLSADSFCADSCSVVLVGRAVRRLRVGRAAQDARDPAEVRVRVRARVRVRDRVRVRVRVRARVRVILGLGIQALRRTRCT